MSNKNKNEIIYRVIYDNKDVFKAFRHHLTSDQWEGFLKSDIIHYYMAKPVISKNNKRYFTQVGYDLFIGFTYPTMCEIGLDPFQFTVVTYNLNDIRNVIWQDKYQIIAAR